MTSESSPSGSSATHLHTINHQQARIGIRHQVLQGGKGVYAEQRQVESKVSVSSSSASATKQAKHRPLQNHRT